MENFNLELVILIVDRKYISRELGGCKNGETKQEKKEKNCIVANVGEREANVRLRRHPCQGKEEAWLLRKWRRK